MVSVRKLGFLIFCVSLVCAVTAKSATVALIDQVTGKNSGWEIVVSPNLTEAGSVAFPYVYRVTSDAVVVELDKTFTHVPEDDLFKPIIVEFLKASANATRDIIIEDEYIVNDTDTTWFDFHMQLMVSVSNPQAGFNPNFVPDGGQLENVYYSTNYGYGGRPVELHFVDSGGGGVPASPPGSDVFQPGYDGGKIVITTNPDMAVGTRFGLKEVPTIPEPVTVLLLGFGCTLAGFVRKGKSARAS